MTSPTFQIDRPVDGKPLSVGGWTLRPTARLTARGMALPFGGGWSARLSPEAVEVEGEGVPATRLELAAAPDRASSLVWVAAAVAAACAVVIVVARLGARPAAAIPAPESED